MTNILNLTLPEYIKAIDNLTKEQIIELISSKEFENSKENIIICTFTKIDSELKHIFVNNSNLLYKLLVAVSKQKSRFNVFDNEIQELIVEKIKSFIELSEKDYMTLLKSMSPKIYLKFIENLNNYISNNDIESSNKLLMDVKEIYTTKNTEKVRNYVLKKFNIRNENFLNTVTFDFINQKRNIFELYRIETYEQLYIYSKFGIVVTKEIFELEKQNEYNISLELLEKLNAKHVRRIIKELMEKEDYIDSEVLFVTAIKLYCLFGIDNALKIVKDKFTQNTDASVQTAAELQFTFDRRLYRLNHPDEFLNYELIEKLKKSIQSGELGVIKKITSDSDMVHITGLFDQLSENYKLYKNDNRLIGYFNDIIKDEIVLRELKLKNLFTADYYQKKFIPRENITCLELFNIFKEFDSFYTKFDDNSNVEMDKKLKTFLLHNEKSDKTNCALIRMVFNKQGLDYNTELIHIINNYYKILEIKEQNRLKSKNSLLDTLDIYKTLQYKLSYDELDIPLSIISKIALSKKHLIVKPEEAITEFKRIYKEHKKKFNSTIPKVKGETKNKYKYKILDKNDPELLTCGIDVGSCFKPGAQGGAFYEYALTSIYSDVIGIWDPKGNFYMCPIIRNGNGIYGNGLDPEKIAEDVLPFVMEALKKCYNEIIKKSVPEEKIDFCTLTNLHEHIKDDNRKQPIYIEKIPMIGEYFYCDITKNNMDSYVLAGDASIIKEYVPTKTYDTTRNKNYIYSKVQQENRLLIEQRINEIEYKSIDLKSISEIEKKILKENYKEIKVDDYAYIVCNEDWYIALSDNLEIKNAVLPYDPRAKFEYLTELQRVKSNYQIITQLENRKTK